MSVEYEQDSEPFFLSHKQTVMKSSSEKDCERVWTIYRRGAGSILPFLVMANLLYMVKNQWFVPQPPTSLTTTVKPIPCPTLRSPLAAEEVGDKLFQGRIQEPAFLENNVDATDGHPWVAWLMSFPNSGTSYTIALTREASNTTTATNYADHDELDDPLNAPPVVPGSSVPPFFRIIPDRHTNVPNKYVLTKTHCAGYCSECKPTDYLETPRSFKMACHRGRRTVLTNHGVDVEHGLQYNASLVKKAIHIIRHPLDNVVARFHLMFDKQEDFASKYANTVDGFHKWCGEQDKAVNFDGLRWMDQRLQDAFKSVPCHQEFFRYVQWHNLAFSTTRDMSLPTLVMYYHDYTADWESALKRILAFLELPRTENVEPFLSGKQYKDYYTKEERAAVLELVKELSTEETWSFVNVFDF